MNFNTAAMLFLFALTAWGAIVTGLQEQKLDNWMERFEDRLDGHCFRAARPLPPTEVADTGFPIKEPR